MGGFPLILCGAFPELDGTGVRVIFTGLSLSKLDEARVIFTCLTLAKWEGAGIIFRTLLLPLLFPSPVLMDPLPEIQATWLIY